MGSAVRESNLDGRENFCTRPGRSWGPNSLMYKMCQVSFPGEKNPRCGFDHPPPSSAEVKERIQLYLYSLSGLSWPVLG